MLKQALQKAKKEEDKKVSINFQLPLSLKDEFDSLCQRHSVSLTAMLNSLIEVAIEEDKNSSNSAESIEDLINQCHQLHKMVENGVDESDIGFDPAIALKLYQEKIKTRSN